MREAQEGDGSSNGEEEEDEVEVVEWRVPRWAVDASSEGSKPRVEEFMNISNPECRVDGEVLKTVGSLSERTRMYFPVGSLWVKGDLRDKLKVFASNNAFSVAMRRKDFECTRGKKQNAGRYDRSSMKCGCEFLIRWVKIHPL